MIPRNRIRIITLSISVFLALGIVSTAYVTMPMNDDGTMANCPYLGITALCTMQPLAHVAAVQNMLAALPAQTASLFGLLALCAFAILSAYAGKRDRGEPLCVPQGRRRRMRMRITGTIDALQEQFSNGILHTKVF